METASQMVEAMQSSGGVPGLNVSLCDHVVPPSLAGQVKRDGVSTVANVEYGNTYIRVWKAYRIGPGKKIPLSKINIPANFQIARLSAVTSDNKLCDQFSAVKSRKAPTSSTTSFLSKVQGRNPCQLVFLLKVVSYMHAQRKAAQNHIRGSRHCRGTKTAASTSTLQVHAY